MMDPFQRQPIVQGLAAGVGALETWNLMSLNVPKKICQWAHAGDLITELHSPNAHIARILTGPTPMEVAAWRGFHKVIYHAVDGISGLIPSVGHHSFYNAYVCNVGTEDTVPLVSLPLLDVIRLQECKAANPQEGLGAPACLND